MEQKILAATLYLKDGIPVKSPQDLSVAGDLQFLAKTYNDGGIDKIFVFDLSSNDMEHEKNLLTIRELNRLIEIPTCGGGNINRLEDIKKLLYAGCKQVLINGSKSYCFELVNEASSRFGREKILLSIKNVDFIFSHIGANILYSVDNIINHKTRADGKNINIGRYCMIWLRFCSAVSQLGNRRRAADFAAAVAGNSKPAQGDRSLFWLFFLFRYKSRTFFPGKKRSA